MDIKWPKTLGDRDRTKQYDAYVKPLSAEEKIMITQKAHSKTQIELNKAVKNIEHAITCYFRAQYGAKEVISKLDGVRNELRDVQEEIMKLTMNALPYKDLDVERESEKSFMVPLEFFSLKTILYILLFVCNAAVYVSAFVFTISWLYVVGVFFSIGIVLFWFTLWSTKTERLLPSSKKVGPRL